MPAPLQHIHAQQRRIGQLHEKDPFTRNLDDCVGIVAQGEGVEAVEDDAQRRMVDLLHQRPDIAPGLHVTAPGQGLVTDPQATRTGALGDEGEVAEQGLAVAQRIGLHIAAQQHQLGAEFLHQVELALGAIEVALQTLARTALEIAKRLEQGDLEPQVLAASTNVLRAAGVIEQVILEQLDAVEAGGGHGLQFLRQGTAQGHGGDRAFHAVTPVTEGRGKLCGSSGLDTCMIRAPGHRAHPARSAATSSHSDQVSPQPNPPAAHAVAWRWRRCSP